MIVYSSDELSLILIVTLTQKPKGMIDHYISFMLFEFELVETLIQKLNIR